MGDNVKEQQRENELEHVDGVHTPLSTLLVVKKAPNSIYLRKERGEGQGEADMEDPAPTHASKVRWLAHGDQ
eukprot:scaffold288_cov219-Pinguiococcus_pyrenoidosus.AAC.1